MTIATFLRVDLRGDVAPVDDDQLAIAATGAGHHATRLDSEIDDAVWRLRG